MTSTVGIALRSGNEMAAHGALAAGCTFFSGYPITPSSAVYAEMMRLLPARGGVALGAPDEISALSYAVGASLGAKLFDLLIRAGGVGLAWTAMAAVLALVALLAAGLLQASGVRPDRERAGKGADDPGASLAPSI